MNYDQFAWEPCILKHKPGYDDPYNICGRGESYINPFKGKPTCVLDMKTDQITWYASGLSAAKAIGFVGNGIGNVIRHRTLVNKRYIFAYTLEKLNASKEFNHARNLRRARANLLIKEMYNMWH